MTKLGRVEILIPILREREGVAEAMPRMRKAGMKESRS